jgi:hypothetical protein
MDSRPGSRAFGFDDAARSRDAGINGGRMTSPSGGRVNVALIVAIAFSVFCWVCLYAAFADFAQLGFELMAQPSPLHSAAGVAFVLMHALGLLLLFLLAGGALAVMVSTVTEQNGEDRAVNGTSH